MSTPTPSLRRRILLSTIGSLAVLLIVLGVTIDFAVGYQARQDLRDDFAAATSRADTMTRDNAPPDDIAAQLNDGGIRALVVTADGATFGDRSIDAALQPGPAVNLPTEAAERSHGAGHDNDPHHAEQTDATSMVATHPLPGGGRIVLVADTSDTDRLLDQLRRIMVISALATLAVAAAALLAVTNIALRPLNRLTMVAREITTGDRGRRLHPDRTHTELGEAASAFDEMLTALEDSETRALKAEAATRQFLADAAHELRTPIAGIQAVAEQAAASAGQRDDADARRQQRRAELLQRESRRAGRLVADMLDLSRIDAGTPLQIHDCDLVDIADDEVHRASTLAPSLSISRTGESRMPLQADAMRLAQILANLLDNARRYTPIGGSINLDITRKPTAIFVTVTDTGPGVPDNQRQHVFDRLVRLDPARDRDHGGAGLGLAIARALARAHGGDLTCEQYPDGAKFVLTLPAGNHPANSPPASVR